MTETMLERVAEAIGSEMQQMGFEIHDREVIAIATCAIAAMQEPTEAMCCAGGLAIEAAMFADQKSVFESARDEWQAMIAAALAEGEGKKE